MKCSVNCSTVLTLNLSEDDCKALQTVFSILDDIDIQMRNHHIGSLSSDEGSYTLDLRFISDMMDTLEGIKVCDRWVEEE